MSEPQPPLQLTPQRSRCLALWLFGLHLAGLLAVWQSALPGAARVALGLVVIGGGAVAARRHWLWASRITLTWHAEGHWTLQHPGGRIEAHQWAAPYAHPRLVLLRLRTGRWRHCSIALCADSLPGELHRRLRVRLRAGQTAERGM